MPRIGLIGGTGDEGRGLAVRFALAGEEVLIGSRSRERAEQAAAVVRSRLGEKAHQIVAGTNVDAAGEAEIVCVCLPMPAVNETLSDLRQSLRGRTVIEVINPVRRTAQGFEPVLLAAPSAAEWVAALLPEAEVVSAFKTFSAAHLANLERPLQGDAFICGDGRETKQQVLDLVRRIPRLRPVDCGALRNARYVEAAAVLILEINRRHRATASLRVLGLDD